MMRTLQFIPLFGVLLFIYWFCTKINFFPWHLNDVLFVLRLPSRVMWKPTWGDLLVLVGVMTLYI